MTLTLAEIVQVLDQEVLWCQRNPDASLPAGYQQGFIKGLIQAKFLLESACRAVLGTPTPQGEPRRLAPLLPPDWANAPAWANWATLALSHRPLDEHSRLTFQWVWHASIPRLGPLGYTPAGTYLPQGEPVDVPLGLDWRVVLQRRPEPKET